MQQVLGNMSMIVMVVEYQRSNYIMRLPQLLQLKLGPLNVQIRVQCCGMTTNELACSQNENKIVLQDVQLEYKLYHLHRCKSDGKASG